MMKQQLQSIKNTKHNLLSTQPSILPLTTKVFKSGNSQAVRIPASLRLNTERVVISKTANGGLLIEPLTSLTNNNSSMGSELLSILSEFDDEFINAVSARHQDVMDSMQEREGL